MSPTRARELIVEAALKWSQDLDDRSLYEVVAVAKEHLEPKLNGSPLKPGTLRAEVAWALFASRNRFLGGCSTQHVVKLLRRDHQSVSAAISYLRRDGHVQPSAGHASVWQLTVAGEAMVRQMAASVSKG